jgi:hypothetical protein
MRIVALVSSVFMVAFASSDGRAQEKMTPEVALKRLAYDAVTLRLSQPDLCARPRTGPTEKCNRDFAVAHLAFERVISRQLMLNVAAESGGVRFELTRALHADSVIELNVILDLLRESYYPVQTTSQAPQLAGEGKPAGTKPTTKPPTKPPRVLRAGERQ